MKNMNIVLKVERTSCKRLSGMFRTSPGKVIIPEGAGWQNIKIRPLASLQVSEKVEDKVHLYTATLKFYTCQRMEDRGNDAYRLTMMGCSHRLIGTSERPYPVMTIAESAPEKVTDNQWNEVTVTWTSQWQIPQIG